MHRRNCITALIALACLASAPVPSLGCVADTFTLDRLATESAYVVTATVGDIHSSWTPDNTRIESVITLTAVQRITRDGAVAEPDITYTIIGGTVGDSTLRMSCAPELHTGEHWVLFLQRTYHQHPVLGMERGMFRIEQAQNDVARVRTSGGEVVAAIGEAGEIGVAEAQPLSESQVFIRQPRAISGHVVAVHVVDRKEAAIANAPPAAPSPGLTLEDFLTQVRHRLPEAVARADGPITVTRITSPMKPTRLRPALHPEGNPGGAK